MKKLTKEDVTKFLNSTGLKYKAPFDENDLLEAMNHAYELAMKEKVECDHDVLNDHHIDNIITVIDQTMVGYNTNGTISGCLTQKEFPKLKENLKEVKLKV